MKRKIILAAIIGVIALSTASITIAWYSNSNLLNVDDVIVEIKSERTLKISTSSDIESFDRENASSLSNSDLNDVPVYIPTSTMYKENWMSISSNSPIFYDSSNSLVSKNGVPFLRESMNGYLSQELYILSEDDDVYVTLDALSTSLVANTLFNNAHAQYLKEQFPNKYGSMSKEEIVTRLDELVKAMRFSLLVTDESIDEYEYVVIDPNYNEEVVYLGGALDNSISGYYDSFSPNGSERFETIYGQIGDREKAVYDDALPEDSELIGEKSAFNAKHEAGVKRFNLEKSLENGLEIAQEERLSLDDFKEGEQPTFYFPVYQGIPKRVVLSIYIEGWDLDSVNYTMGASFIADLAFRIWREM